MVARIPATKLILLAVLGFLAIVLGSIVVTYQLRVIQEKKKRGITGRKSSSVDDSGSEKTNTSWLTNKKSAATIPYDIRLWNLYPAPEGGNRKTIGEAYWRQVQSFLRDWKDAAVYPPDPSDYHTYATDWMVRQSSEYRASYSPKNNSTSGDAYYFYPRLALERAANAGHPMAQHYLANALSSGIWPVPAVGGDGSGSREDSESSPYTASSVVEDLHVFDEWLPSAREDRSQINKAFLLWHMAAMGGNIESAMALAYRLDDAEDSSCEEVLPYYQAAADGVMDQLETSKHSRAKVIPSMDRHSLATVHMHGGTSSQLDWNNKPDESKEALQFYHLKATTVPWSLKKKSEDDKSQKNKKDNKKKLAVDQHEGIDVSAAYTLAHLYHYGLRGVEQNLTKSLQYYEIAGNHGHWESAGHACIFHLWGIGVNQNAREAVNFCQLGAPTGYEGCLQRYERLQTKKKTGETISQCDENALNGMGLLHLLGIQGGVLKVDLSMAEKYFTLAKELGGVDAYYNLAMMRLGWKTHFKTIHELAENGFSKTSNVETELPIPGKNKKNTSEKYILYESKEGDKLYFKGPIQQDVLNAIKLLGVAAKLGHVQAKHRLGSIYAEGLNLTTSVIKYNFVKKDCKRAKDHFQWIINNASPTRSNRLRRAYKEYMAGNLEVSVRNYLAAAEIGSTVGQVNAAFLMERGVCLGLSPVNCAKASVRLWKAAAVRGNAEACLRAGDFYYYGRLRGNKLRTGPFGWIQYILYPESYVLSMVKEFGFKFFNYLTMNIGGRENSSEPNFESSTSESCSVEEGTFPSDDQTHPNDHDFFEDDLHTAAHYYQLAGERHLSARANFNLGFMHQWGLGLKQDFPLAKRYYDLALSRNYHEAEIAVQIALMAMNSHEFIIRNTVRLEEWWHRGEAASNTVTRKDSPSSPNAAPSPQVSESKKSTEEVILSHLFDRSSFFILVLFLLIIAIQIIMAIIGRPQR